MKKIFQTLILLCLRKEEMKEKMDEKRILKYPRTPHLEGSRLQPGDEDLSQIPFADIRGRHLVAEEKIDGANSGISFNEQGELLLQSRGHYLTGGYRERHYNLMKQWAMVHKDIFYSVLGSRYIMYGEWMYAKHTLYYDALPHYFMEFDIYDRKEGIYLDTPSRKKMTAQMPICSVPVLDARKFDRKEELLSLVGPSNYMTENLRQNLYDSAVKLGLDPERACRETELSGLMEGIYLKVEENGQVVKRLKYVRAAFSQSLDASDSHWIDRPIIPNQLAVPPDKLFEARIL